MDSSEYDRQLRLLGLHGPMGELRLADGSFILVYKLPDGTHKHLSPPDTLSGTTYPGDFRVEALSWDRRAQQSLTNLSWVSSQLHNSCVYGHEPRPHLFDLGARPAYGAWKSF